MSTCKINRMKAKARAAYMRMQRELDTVDCGISMLCTIRPSFSKIVAEYDAAIAWLRANDPNFPKAEVHS